MSARADRITPGRRNPDTGPQTDPFELGAARDPAEDFDPALAEAASSILSAITQPCSLSEVLSGLAIRTDLTDRLEPRQQALLPWVLAVTVASAYGSTDSGEPGTSPGSLAEGQLRVLRTGRAFDHGPVAGDDLLLMPAVSRQAAP